MERRHSSRLGRALTPYEQALERFAASRAGAWLFLHVLNRADRVVLPLSRGRLTAAVGAPVGLLESTGARTGRRRRTPLLHFEDGDAIVVVASNGGGPRAPGWLHNVRAEPAVRFLAPGRGWEKRRAHVAEGAERARLWAAANDLYGGYEAYQSRAGARVIAVVVLEPDDDAGRR